MLIGFIVSSIIHSSSLLAFVYSYIYIWVDDDDDDDGYINMSRQRPYIIYMGIVIFLKEYTTY